MNSKIRQISVPKYIFNNNSDITDGYRNNSHASITFASKVIPKNSENSVLGIYGSVYESQVPSKDDFIGRSICIVSATTILGVDTAVTTNGFNAQTIKYVSAINEQQAILTQNNQDFLASKYASGEQLNATALRNKSAWTNVKRLVIRDELMKLQIGDVTDLPLTESDINILKSKIGNTDLSNFSDTDLQNIIDSIMKPDEKTCLAAFKAFKEDNVINDYFQLDKLDELRDALADIDLDKITAKEFKKLVDNYWEKLEIHHRTSISEDPTLQNDINNLDTLNTSQHDAKHTDPETDKINYKKPLKEELLDRQGELEKLNRKRVIKNELKGLGITLAIAAGTGFTIGFIMSLAKSGISPHCLKHAFVSGAKSSGESSAMALVGYGISRTIGGKLSESLSEVIASKLGETVAEETLANISKMCTMGVVGVLTIAVSTVYQFCKLKKAGYSTKECLLRSGKSAALSLGLLALSIAAQGIWGGPAGMIVSISSGIIVTGVSIVCIIHDKNIRQEIHLYLIKISYPKNFAIA